MSTSITRRQLLAQCGALALPLAAQAATRPASIRIGSPEMGVGDKHFPGADVLAIARAKGWLEEEFARDGIKIEWNFFRAAGPAVNEAVSAGQLDFVFLGDLAGVIGRARGLATRLVMPASRNTNSYLAVAPGSGIRSFADLKGRKVAVLKGTAYQRPFDHLLADAGLTEHDIKSINMDWPTSKAALVVKDIDATFGGSDLRLLLDKGVTLAVDTRGRGPAYTINAGLIATQAFIDAYPEITTRLVRQLVRAAQWASDETHRDALVQLYAEQSGLPASIYRAELEGLSLKSAASPRLDANFRAGYKIVVAEALKLGLIRNDVDVDAWIDARFVHSAIAQLGLENEWPEYDADGKPLAKRAAA